jgi:hypothetical protein
MNQQSSLPPVAGCTIESHSLVECRLSEPAEEPLEIAVDLVATSAVHRDDPGDRDAAD